MKKFIWLVALLALGACGEKPTDTFHHGDPGDSIVIEGNVVTFDRYDENSVPLSTAAAYYCSTSAQFDDAVNNAGAGDIILLTKDDVEYEACTSDFDCYASIIGIADGRSAIKLSGSTCSSTRSNFTFPTGDITIDNVEMAGGTYGLSFEEGDNDVTNCGSAPGGLALMFIWASDDASVVVTDCNEARLSASENGSITASNNDWAYSTAVCDRPCGEPSGGCDDGITVETWVYDGDIYNNAAMDDTDFEASGTEGFKRCGTWPNFTETLYVRYNDGAGGLGGYVADHNSWEIERSIEYGTSSGTYEYTQTTTTICETEFRAKFDVTDFDPLDYVYWRAKFTMCDWTWYSVEESYRVPAAATCTTPAWYDCY